MIKTFHVLGCVGITVYIDRSVHQRTAVQHNKLKHIGALKV